MFHSFTFWRSVSPSPIWDVCIGSPEFVTLFLRCLWNGLESFNVSPPLPEWDAIHHAPCLLCVCSENIHWQPMTREIKSAIETSGITAKWRLMFRVMFRWNEVVFECWREDFSFILWFFFSYKSEMSVVFARFGFCCSICIDYYMRDATEQNSEIKVFFHFDI